MAYALPSQIHAVVERYLTGEASFDQAAREVSSIFGSILMRSSSRSSYGAIQTSRSEVPPRTISIGPLPPEQVARWLGLPHGPGSLPQASAVTLGLGGSVADQPKVMALFREAFLHLHVWHHIWRRFGRDAA